MGWPDIQQLAHWCSGSVENSQVQATWRSKSNVAPSSGHVNKGAPGLYPLRGITLSLMNMEIKYVYEDVIWEYVD